jgi:hypothetical protein
MSILHPGTVTWRRLAFLVVLACASPVAIAACPPSGWSRAGLDSLKATEFRIEASDRRADLALGLLDCLGARDPVLRDGIAFEAWSTWLRAGQLDEDTRQAALARLLPRILPVARDAGAGFSAPFAALVLSEIARSDRVAPWRTPQRREQVIAAGTAYLSSVRDYRGFDARDGWRHGVAHGADLMLQLALNPALDKGQLDRVFAAVASQVAPAGHAYVYGEPERLARPVLYGALRGLHTEADWSAWFEALSGPGDAASWQAAIGTQAGLARRHDLRAFLLAIYVEIAEETRPELVAMRPAVLAALKRVPA